MEGGRGGKACGSGRQDFNSRREVTQRPAQKRVYNNEDTMPENKSEEEKWKKFCELEASKQESCKVSTFKDSTPVQSP